ncbi:MAG TPA: hypothetical protein VLF40_02595 [Candidatus Saccharimonadales bacterium]|nr:hypothetical protein [Candidatus Saccharimonadales bacterium]
MEQLKTERITREALNQAYVRNLAAVSLQEVVPTNYGDFLQLPGGRYGPPELIRIPPGVKIYRDDDPTYLEYIKPDGSRGAYDPWERVPRAVLQRERAVAAAAEGRPPEPARHQLDRLKQLGRTVLNWRPFRRRPAPAPALAAEPLAPPVPAVFEQQGQFTSPLAALPERQPDLNATVPFSLDEHAEAPVIDHSPLAAARTIAHYPEAGPDPDDAIEGALRDVAKALGYNRGFVDAWELKHTFPFKARNAVRNTLDHYRHDILAAHRANQVDPAAIAKMDALLSFCRENGIPLN